MTLKTECLRLSDISTVGVIGLFHDQSPCGGHPGTWFKFSYSQNRGLSLQSLQYASILLCGGLNGKQPNKLTCLLKNPVSFHLKISILITLMKPNLLEKNNLYLNQFSFCSFTRIKNSFANQFMDSFL